MTPKGEQMTVKGEFQENIFNRKQDLSVSYSKDCATIALSEIIDTFQQKSDQPVFQMMFMIKGKLSYLLNGSHSPLTIMENQQHNLMWTDPKLLRLQSETEEQCDFICINLSLAFLSRYLPQEHIAYRQLLNGATEGHPTLFSGQNMHITPEMNAILYSIEHSTHTGFCEKLFLESKVIELLALQISQFEQIQIKDINPSLKRDELDKMYEVREILISNIDRQLSLRTLAHMVGTNEFNLKKHFKTAFGTTVYGYLNQYKMEQAKSLLIRGESNVSEVSGKMGYKHATHFTSAFKKYFGYLPTKIKMFVLLFDPEFCLVFFSEMAYL